MEIRNNNCVNEKAHKKRFGYDESNPETVLGQGAFGTVYRGIDKKNGHDVAIKIIKKDKLALET